MTMYRLNKCYVIVKENIIAITDGWAVNKAGKKFIYHTCYETLDEAKEWAVKLLQYQITKLEVDITYLCNKIRSIEETTFDGKKH